MENRSRVCDIKKKFEHLNVQSREVKCHIKRSNAFRSDKPLGPPAPRTGETGENERCNLSNNNIANLLVDLTKRNPGLGLIKPPDTRIKPKSENVPPSVRNTKLVSPLPKSRLSCNKNEESPTIKNGKEETTPALLREVLKTPLPKGPPPKKPPRTFQHVVNQVIAINNSQTRQFQDVSIKVLDTKNKAGLKLTLSAEPKVPFPTFRPPPPTRSKTESHIIIKKLNTSLLGNIFGSVPSRASNKTPTKTATTVKSETLLCLNSFNCTSNGSVQNIYDVPFEPKQKFLTEVPRQNKPNNNVNVSHNAYGMLKKSPDSNHIYSEPYSPNLSRKLRKLESATLSFNSLGSENKKPSESPLDFKKPLYYMSTPIGEHEKTIPEPASSSHSPENNGDLYAAPTPKNINSLKGKEKQAVKHDEVHLMLKEIYGGLNAESTAESDTDSATSVTEESPGRNLSVNHEELTLKRKSYVRQMSNMRRQISIMKSPSNSLFDLLLLVGLDQDPSKGKVPYIKSRYPQFGKVPFLIEEFCFPDASEWPPSQYCHNNYTLVLTSEDGDRKYAYCKRLQPEGALFCLPLAYCIITSNKSSGFYYKVLGKLESNHGKPENQFKKIVQKLYESKFPDCGEGIPWYTSTILRRPTDYREENNDLVKMLKIITIPLFLQLFSTILLERKVIIIGSNISKVSDCIEGIQNCLYPFEWQHTLVTSLPSSLLEICQAPTPYLMGIVSNTIGNLSLSQIDEVIVFDMDKGDIVRKVGDEDSILPKKYSKCLKQALEISMRCEDNNAVISEAFIRLFIELIGHFRQHILAVPNETAKVFQRDEFVKSVGSHSLQMFLDWFTETSMFQAFISQHLEKPVKMTLFDKKCAEFIGQNVKKMNSKKKISIAFRNNGHFGKVK